MKEFQCTNNLRSVKLRCQETATHYYRRDAYNGGRQPDMVCRCEKHRLVYDSTYQGESWKEITFEDAVIIAVHES
jgi:hypothetical protein